MSKLAVHFSSKHTEWETPQDFFDEQNKWFSFDLDVCALPGNAKCDKFFSPEDNGLEQEWTGTCWMNPPYGRGIASWIEKAANCGCTVVCLLPARTDTAWFHDHILAAKLDGRATIKFIRGRLKFGGAKNSAPFPSMLVVFRA